MCLDTRNRRVIDPPLKTERWAWKVFQIRGGRYTFPVFSEHSLLKGRWLNARGAESDPAGVDGYFKGFHSFSRKKDVKHWIQSVDGSYLKYCDVAIVKVRVRNIVAEGTKDGYQCIVSKELFVPKEKTNG